MGGRTLCLVSLAIASLAVSSVMGKSIMPVKSENPCPGKYYCETPPDYPAALILNLLRNQNFPRGLFDGQEDKENSERINNDIFHLMPRLKSDEVNKQQSDNEIKETSINTEYSKNAHANEIVTV
eukprot:TRINITY_DN20017_c0_g1_i1.p1 TRINITY_DN20017_c0_g1~~TRINITY_DN20017_c0_g1_i1.p1  ORF type:complete len:139 (-),score=34.84 TRINITY_DN20017_c0_g1_i1:14-388(-)